MLVLINEYDIKYLEELLACKDMTTIKLTTTWLRLKDFAGDDAC